MGQLVKQFVNHFGLDLKSSDLNRAPEFATRIQNAQYKKNGNIGKREGFRAAAESCGGYGADVYRRISPTTGLTERIVVAADENLSRLNTSTFTISYSGAAASVITELFLDSDAGEYKLQIIEDTTTVLDTGLDVGFDEATSKTLANLKIEIDALTDFSATITGDDTVPAAFLEFIRGVNLADGDTTTEARYWTQINSPVANPFSGFFANRANEDFENMTFAQVNNVIFMAAKGVNLHKYDGQNVYLAGMPVAPQPSLAVGGGGVLTGIYGYKLRYTQFDAVGNLVEGQPTINSVGLGPAANSIDVTVDNILAASGYNTNAAIVAGAQVGVNVITVDDGSGGSHTLQVGDKAYFFDGVAGEFSTRNVTARTSSSITIDGAAVDVADNAVISNDLRIGIYRSVAGGNQQFLVAEIPNDPFNATQVFNDNTADGDLGIPLIEPDFQEAPPPQTKYVAKFNNQLLLANSSADANIVLWTPPGRPENFSPTLRNTLVGEDITGIYQNNEVVGVWEEQITHIISGDLATDRIRVDVLDDDVGCVAHHSIKEVRGTTYFLSDRGPYRMVSGQQPQNISEAIEPIFDFDPTLPANEKLVLKRAVAANHRDKEQYILYIPAETNQSGDVESNNFSLLFVQDYFRSAWLQWSNMNMAGGAVVVEDDLFWIERRFSTFENDVEHVLYKQQNRGDNWDFQDNISPTSWIYGSAWYFFGEPSIYKKWLRFKLFGIEETESNTFTVDVTLERDFIEDLVIGEILLDFASTGDGYGIGPYGTTPYGDISDPNRKAKIGPIKAKSMRFLMANENDRENVDVTGWEIELADGFRRELKE